MSITMASTTWDVAVIGAGVFGSWTAYSLRERGLKVLLLDAYGAASSRASSGGESRIIRMGYGADEIYTRWSMESLGRWKSIFAEAGRPLFLETGVLWMAHENGGRLSDTVNTLTRCGVPFEQLSRSEMEHRFPQFDFGQAETALYEPTSGSLLARRTVHTVVDQAVRNGVEYRIDSISPYCPAGPISGLTTVTGAVISAGAYVFACGPWLPKVLPDVLGNRIFPTQQEVFFFGTPPASPLWTAPAMPAWIDVGTHYGLPDLENRGFKVASDRHGAHIDPDTATRLPSAESIAAVRAFMSERFPALRDAPIIETRVCQYESTSSGDFLIDRHPESANVWIAGGGSGHGFKHGPAVGRYVADRILDGGPVEPRFSLATKGTVQRRAIY